MYDSEHVYFLDIYPRTPVYHRRGEDGNQDGNWMVWSVCGKEIIKDTERYMWSATSIPFRHARFFARPCKQCWPASAPRPLPAPLTSHLAWRVPLQ